jgi:hypothetical protein
MVVEWYVVFYSRFLVGPTPLIYQTKFKNDNVVRYVLDQLAYNKI